MRATIALALAAAPMAAAQPVQVWVDMDAGSPGFQATVNVPPGTTTVPVSVYIWDPQGGRSVLSIGYIGGLDRGISFGHIPGNNVVGTVTGLTGQAAAPVNPANTGYVYHAQQPGFAGPEVQYNELGASNPAAIAGAPTSPVFTVNVHLSGAATGDTFKFALLDLVTVWRGGAGGAFTPNSAGLLTTGGDAVPDLTPSVAGIDADVPQPVPPAAFTVDYVDGGHGPAEVRVGGCYANCDGSTSAPVLNVADFACFLQEFASGRMYANCDGSHVAPVLNMADFTCFLQRFAAGCQ